MSVDLTSEGGTAILKRLVQWADVVITNFPHGTREALHLGYEEVSGWNPRVIYADITGFGDAGPDARLPGFDLTAFWSRTGLLAATRDAGAPPTSPPWGQHAAELADVLDAEFRSQPLAHWKEVLDTARVPYGVIQSPEEAAADPQLRAADIVVPIEGARDLDYTVNKPITLRGLARVPFRRAPEHGEHTDEVLAQLGFSADDIAQRREQKAIPAAPERETTK